MSQIYEGLSPRLFMKSVICNFNFYPVKLINWFIYYTHWSIWPYAFNSNANVNSNFKSSWTQTSHVLCCPELCALSAKDMTYSDCWQHLSEFSMRICSEGWVSAEHTKGSRFLTHYLIKKDSILLESDAIFAQKLSVKFAQYLSRMHNRMKIKAFPTMLTKLFFWDLIIAPRITSAPRTWVTVFNVLKARKARNVFITE